MTWHSRAVIPANMQIFLESRRYPDTGQVETSIVVRVYGTRGQVVENRFGPYPYTLAELEAEEWSRFRQAVELCIAKARRVVIPDTFDAKADS